MCAVIYSPYLTKAKSNLKQRHFSAKVDKRGTRKGEPYSSPYQVLWLAMDGWVLAPASCRGTENMVALSSKTPFQRGKASCAVGRDTTLMPFQIGKGQLGRAGGALHSLKAGEAPKPVVRGGWCHWVLDHAMLYYSREEPSGCRHSAGSKRQPEREQLALKWWWWVQDCSAGEVRGTKRGLGHEETDSVFVLQMLSLP